MFPVVAVNEANTKHMFDNRYGTGQSTLDGVLRATNILIAGTHRLRGRLRLVRPRPGDAHEGPRRRRDRDRGRPGAGARGGHGRVPRACPIAEAAKVAQLFVTVTGDIHVLRKEHFEAMQDGAIVANTGHFNVEIDIPALAKRSR